MSQETREIYQGLGTWYDRWTLVLDRTALNRMRHAVFQHADGKVLEIAVGTGKNFRFSHRAVDAWLEGAGTRSPPPRRA